MVGEGPVTVLVTDVEGSTELRTRRGYEAAHAILRAHEELVRAQVQRHGGREVKALGDGCLLAFGSARRALACAVGIIAATLGGALFAHPSADGKRCQRRRSSSPRSRPS